MLFEACLVLSVLFVCGERAGAVCLLCDCVGARHVCLWRFCRRRLVSLILLRAALLSAAENRVTDRENLYKNYAPEQYALLEDSVIKINGNIVFYCTAVNSDALYEAYKKAL